MFRGNPGQVESGIQQDLAGMDKGRASDPGPSGVTDAIGTATAMSSGAGRFIAARISLTGIDRHHLALAALLDQIAGDREALDVVA